MNVDKKILFGTIVLCIMSCKVVSMPGQESRSNSPSKAWLQNSEEPSVPFIASCTSDVTITVKTANISTTNTLTPTYKLVKLNTLPSGRYIIYSIVNKDDGISHFIVSEEGEEMGLFSSEQGIPYISPNQKLIAFIFYTKLMILNIEQNEINVLPIEDNRVWSGSGELAWGPESDRLAITSSSSIIIISIEDGKKIGEIINYLDPQPKSESDSIPLSPKWSSSGKWIAYYILTGHMEHPPSPGPYVSDTSCMTDPEGCEKKTKLVVDSGEQLLDWTPDNHLAVFDKHDKINLYDVVTSSLMKEIQIPDAIGYAEYIKWSNDNEWVAFGGECGICIMSIKTGETKVLSTKGFMVEFWYIVP